MTLQAQPWKWAELRAERESRQGGSQSLYWEHKLSTGRKEKGERVEGLQSGDLSENHGQRSSCALRASLLCKSEGGRGDILETDPLELYLKDPEPYKPKRGTGACRAGPSGSDQ